MYRARNVARRTFACDQQAGKQIGRSRIAPLCRNAQMLNRQNIVRLHLLGRTQDRTEEIMHLAAQLGSV